MTDLPILRSRHRQLDFPADAMAAGLKREAIAMPTQQSPRTADLPRAEQIAQLNDHLRTTGTGGTVMITQNVQRVTGFDSAALAAALANYDGFDPDNDPHGERDFGDLTLWGYDLIWKVDYYDPDLKYGSNDPADPQVTHRVLTVMLATDW